MIQLMPKRTSRPLKSEKENYGSGKRNDKKGGCVLFPSLPWAKPGISKYNREHNKKFRYFLTAWAGQ